MRRAPDDAVSARRFGGIQRGIGYRKKTRIHLIADRCQCRAADADRQYPRDGRGWMNNCQPFDAVPEVVSDLLRGVALHAIAALVALRT